VLILNYKHVRTAGFRVKEECSVQVTSSCDTVPLPEHKVGREDGHKSMQGEGQVSKSYDAVPLLEHSVVGLDED
jgi:hypothetical protein